ncbi:hypothetical protein FKW77_003559 [Venturia effusa]|uniref:Glycine zipper 2TM domain-containing protein n=1 Tax=Venturia effusa TaxID=50376 RepID=A0A517KW00_9PEZI|nr:hypothetical protein FKW77_003559 [Venturia effusa]
MAAQEYFSSFNERPQQGFAYPATTGPPHYTVPPYQPSVQPHHRPYGAPQVQQQPQPWDPRQGYSYPPPPVCDQGYSPQRPNAAVAQSTLMPPIQPHRSRSQPPDTRRETLDVSHRHHNHHHQHGRRSDTRSRSRSRPRSKHSGHAHHTHKSDSGSNGRPDTRSRARSDRDTFIGAGGGAMIGDTLIPGLGTLGGALLGALGGSKYAKRRSKSDVSEDGHERGRYKDGITVHSRWGSDR